MNPFIKETLEKQMRILSERSIRENGEFLPAITAQMIDLAKLLDPELKSLFYGAALQCLPSATLTMSDLEEIAAARKEKLRRADKEFYRLLNELRKTESDRHPEQDDTPSNQS